MTDWTVLTSPRPATLDDPQAWALHGAARVSHAVDRDLYGHDDMAFSARFLLARMREGAYVRRVGLVAVPAGTTDPGPDDVVGTARVVLPQRDNTHLAHLYVTVHPDHRGLGAGTALLDAAEELATGDGRTTLVLGTEHAGEPGAGAQGVVEPPTGAGRIRTADAGAAMAGRRGYALEQAERYSVLDLPVAEEHLERRWAQARAAAGSDHRLIAWADRVPDEWVDAFAALETRMSAEVPRGGLQVEADRWDEERIRAYEQAYREAGEGYLVVAAQHAATGELAGFTMVNYPLDRPEVVVQEDTLVLPEHRGRRLGMLLKTELLRRLREVRPGARRVHTWNAEENAHMLGINEALGFRLVGVTGQWQKRVR